MRRRASCRKSSMQVMLSIDDRSTTALPVCRDLTRSCSSVADLPVHLRGIQAGLAGRSSAASAGQLAAVGPGPVTDGGFRPDLARVGDPANERRDLHRRAAGGAVVGLTMRGPAAALVRADEGTPGVRRVE